MGKLSREDKYFLGVTATTVFVVVGFWGIVGYIAIHFIIKFW